MIVSILRYIIKKKEGKCMNNSDKIYNHMKEFFEKNGFPPTIKQIADELNIKEHVAQETFEQLKESGRIKITDIPRKTIIEFIE